MPIVSWQLAIAKVPNVTQRCRIELAVERSKMIRVSMHFHLLTIQFDCVGNCPECPLRILSKILRFNLTSLSSAMFFFCSFSFSFLWRLFRFFFLIVFWINFWIVFWIVFWRFFFPRWVVDCGDGCPGRSVGRSVGRSAGRPLGVASFVGSGNYVLGNRYVRK